MKFCENCDNLYSSRIIDDSNNPNKKKIEYYCTVCGSKEIRKSNDPVYVNDYGETTVLGINANTRFDNTLPRLKTISCPQTDCPSHTEKDNNILTIRNNQTDMKHIYICQYCKYTWKV